MDLEVYRESDLERKRTEDLVKLISSVSDKRQSVLDIGARDGFFSKLLTKYFHEITALDLEKPDIFHDKVLCVQGDISRLEFEDNSFDLVFCAEVLEHIPSHLLEKACSELTRVASKWVLIGVPYKQDIRVGRTTCLSCGKKNPPWGHVNSFDREKLKNLFPSLILKKVSFVGEMNEVTNCLSTFFMDLAGNPYGTYLQEETCVHCGKTLQNPLERNVGQKVLTKIAFKINRIQEFFTKPHPRWIHALFKKTNE